MIAEIVVRGWRGGRAPLQGSGLPRIVGRWLAPEPAVDQVVDKNKLSRAGKKCSDRDEPMHWDQWLQVVHNKGLISAYIRRHSQIVEWHKDTVRTDEAKPEMYLAPGLVHHSSGHLGEPEVSSSEDSEDCRHCHDHVEVPDYEVGRVQHDVERRLRQEETA